MKIIFIGSSSFGLKCLQNIFHLSCCDIVGVITAKEHFKISYRPLGVTNVLHADVVGYCEKNKIPCVTLQESMRDIALFDAVKNWRPDAFVVVGWYHMVPKTWMDVAPAYGLHASLLPNYSGGAPLVWALINGETKTGITFFQMDSGVDSGPIVGQKSEEIHSDDTIATLYARIEKKGLELLEKYIPELASGSVKVIKQDESMRRIMPQRCPKDGEIDWNWDAAYITRFIRAQTKPYPGAFGTLDGARLTIWKAKKSQLKIAPRRLATVTRANEHYYVHTGQGVVELIEVELSGEIEMDVIFNGEERVLGVDE